ncbi:hypothetical protein [Streptomyces sp. NPDC004042]|uniref:hypothetical protein n=1 Tax=Streptomyces sp. NPDC004042 TaxID=3154451 RepID=UPI0033AAE4BA
MATDDLVILVHGTFAGDKNGSDEGHRWWQRGSATWTWLRAHLPDGVSLPEGDVRLFHWSGTNSQVERLKASTRLLALMMSLERQGRGYHLVGHSHGGSIIWEALISSAISMDDRSVSLELQWELRKLGFRRRRRSGSKSYHRSFDWWCAVGGAFPLRRLKSWTTVGTPFLHYLPRTGMLTDGWPSPTLSLSKRKEAGFPLFSVLYLLRFVSFIAAFITVLGILYLVPSAVLSGDHLVYRTAGTLTALIVYFSVGRFNAQWSLRSALLSRQYGARLAIERFGGRWLGLWAPTDEAITGLRCLAEPAVHDYTWLSAPRHLRGTPRAATAGGVSGLSALHVPLRIGLPVSAVHLIPEASAFSPQRILTPGYLMFNRWIAPRVSAAVSRLLIRSAQGCDIPGTVLAYASAWPLPLDGLPPGLPEKTAQRLEERSALYAGAIGPVLRHALARTALDGRGVYSAAKTGVDGIEGKPLVHTSYFDDLDVLRLILLHIDRSREHRSPVRDDVLDAWLDATSASVAHRIDAFLTEVTLGQAPPLPRSRVPSASERRQRTSPGWPAGFGRRR